jgi:prepilin-type N-terminal cleavage/methylation domain-containing protein
MNFKTGKTGFTLVEAIVALSLFSIVTVMAASMYILSSQAHSRASIKAELAQNARVALNRMNREIRQSPEVTTDLGSDESEAVSEITFQNGHDTEEIMYIRYYLDEMNLRRAQIVYYFPSEENEYVKYNTYNYNGDLPEEKILEDRLVGEYFDDLKFWKNENAINLELALKLAGHNFQTGGSVYNRN